MAVQPDERLMPEMDSDVEPDWSDEIRRRIEAIDAGEERLLEWDEAAARLFGVTGGAASED